MQYKVDVFVAAHVHNTFASCAVFNGTCAGPEMEQADLYRSPIHLGIGNGGEKLDLVGNATVTPAWVDYQASEHGFVTMDFSATTLTLRYYGDNSTDYHYEMNVDRKYPRS